MLLNVHPSRRVRDDRGSVMAMVIAVMVILGLAMSVLATVVMQNTRLTVGTRSNIAAQAAADAGIERVRKWIDGRTYGQLGTPGTCLPSVGTFAIGDATVTVTAAYRQGTPSPNGCLTAENGTLVVTSTARTPGALDGYEGARTVVAEFDITTPPSPLDNAIFGEGQVTLQNNTKIFDSDGGVNDGHVYTNSTGGFVCTEHARIEGTLTAVHGELSMRNGCTVTGSVWVSGKITFNASGVNVGGDMYTSSTASPWAVESNNSGINVAGNILANGGMKLGGTTVGTAAKPASVWSGAGGMRFEQNARVYGSVYAKNTIDAQQGTRIDRNAISWTGGFTSDNGGATVGGRIAVATSVTNGIHNTPAAGGSCAGSPATGCSSVRPGAPSAWTPAADVPAGVLNAAYDAVQVPERVAFPRISSDAAAKARWQAAGWTYKEITGSACTSEINTMKNGYGAPTVLDFGACTNEIFLDNATINLKNDLAVISDRGFRMQNDLTVKGVGGTFDLLWIVPSDAPGVTWTGPTPSCSSPAGSIFMNKAENVTNIRWFMYTPCNIQVQNALGRSTLPVQGQMYAGGKVELYGNATYLQMPSKDADGKRIDVPGLAGGAASPTTEARVSMSNRYDVPS